MAGRRRRAYRPLLKLTHKVLARARQLLQGEASWLGSRTEAGRLAAPGLGSQLGRYVALTAQVLNRPVGGWCWASRCPTREKVFSIFQAATELINRGKTPQPVEFGHRVLVLEDQLGFIVHYQVLDNGVQDKDVAVSLIEGRPEEGGRQDRVSVV